MERPHSVSAVSGASGDARFASYGGIFTVDRDLFDVAFIARSIKTTMRMMVDCRVDSTQGICARTILARLSQ